MINLALLKLTNIPRAVRLSWLENAIHALIIWRVILTSNVRQTDIVFGMRSGFISRSVHARLQVSVSICRSVTASEFTSITCKQDHCARPRPRLQKSVLGALRVNTKTKMQGQHHCLLVCDLLLLVSVFVPTRNYYIKNEDTQRCGEHCPLLGVHHTEAS